jgi:hypothetical protein
MVLQAHSMAFWTAFLLFSLVQVHGFVVSLSLVEVFLVNGCPVNNL